VNIVSPSLAALLLENKAGLVAKWLEKTLRIYPESSTNYLSRQQDQFQNPVGFRLKEGLAVLFDGLVQPEKKAAAHNALEDILRIRAVQDVSASQAVAFVFMLKQIIRDEFPAVFRSPDECADLELQIDELALAAFDLFMKCREQLYEIKVNEHKRMNFVDKRIQRILDQS
jgi:hypothetical protein